MFEVGQRVIDRLKVAGTPGDESVRGTVVKIIKNDDRNRDIITIRMESGVPREKRFIRQSARARFDVADDQGEADKERREG